MVEKLGERKREPEPKERIGQIIERLGKEQLERKRLGKVIIKGKDAAWEQNPQALCKFLLWDGVWDQVGTPGWKLFVQKIENHSGRHTHQGGIALFVLEGKGYTVVDSVRYDWEEGDLIVLPIKPGGSEHQHFNVDGQGSSYWLSLIYNPMREQAAVELVQNADHPDWKRPEQKMKE